MKDISEYTLESVKFWKFLTWKVIIVPFLKILENIRHFVINSNFCDIIDTVSKHYPEIDMSFTIFKFNCFVF